MFATEAKVAANEMHIDVSEDSLRTGELERVARPEVIAELDALGISPGSLLPPAVRETRKAGRTRS